MKRRSEARSRHILLRRTQSFWLPTKIPSFGRRGKKAGHWAYSLNWPNNTEFPSTFGCKRKISAPSEQQYRFFLANVEANARGGSDILIHAADTDEFVRYISGKLDTAPKPSKGAEQLAVVCSNARGDQAKYGELQQTVTEALREAERSSIIPGQDDDSGQIRLMPLQDDISRADTVVVLCFDQEFLWANRIIQQLGQMMGEQGAKTRIFVTGPEDRKKGKFVPAFKFKTVVGVAPDNRVPVSQVADEIKKIVGGGA